MPEIYIARATHWISARKHQFSGQSERVLVSALNAVAFQDDGGFVLPVYSIALNNSVRERQRPINTWHAVAQHNIRLFAHRAQNLAASQRRANRIAIWTRMRRQKKALALLDV